MITNIPNTPNTPNTKEKAYNNMIIGINTSNPTLVASVFKSLELDQIPKESTFDTKALIKRNIRKDNDEGGPNDLADTEILKIILENSKSQDIDCLEDTLSWGKLEQFKILSQEMTSRGIKKANISLIVDKIISQGDQNLFELILSSGFYNKNEATANLVTAFLDNGDELTEKLVSLGADPTLDGSHQILKALDSRMQTYPSQKAEKKLHSLISLYKTKDLMSINQNVIKNLQGLTQGIIKDKKNSIAKQIMHNQLSNSNNKCLEF